jgi:hypothetical protein
VPGRWAPFRLPRRPLDRKGFASWRSFDPAPRNLAAVASERKTGDLWFRGRVSGLISNDAEQARLQDVRHT